MISVVIPSHNDLYLRETVASVLDNAVGDVEVVVTLDGYDTEVSTDPRVVVVRHPENRGMREAINSAVFASSGEYIMRLDEHCMMAPGWDAALLVEMEDSWVVIPRRYKLDPVTWTRMDDRPVDYEKLLVLERDGWKKFAGVEWKRRARERESILVDETMAFQGSCYLMARTWWDTVVGPLQTEGYGPLYQDSTEISFKTWESGGKIMTCKRTWYAHKHRSFNRTHHYPVRRAKPEWEWTLARWANNYERVREQWGIS